MRCEVQGSGGDGEGGDPMQRRAAMEARACELCSDSFVTPAHSAAVLCGCGPSSFLSTLCHQPQAYHSPHHFPHPSTTCSAPPTTCQDYSQHYFQRSPEISLGFPSIIPSMTPRLSAAISPPSTMISSALPPPFPIPPPVTPWRPNPISCLSHGTTTLGWSVAGVLVGPLGCWTTFWFCLP